MKDQRKTEIKVGLTVLAGILIFLWILGWAKNFSVSSNHRPVLVKFDNVTGLEIGDNVVVNGLRKGFVQNMQIEQDHVIVTMSLEKDVDLREDAQFSISMLDLMGGKKVGAGGLEAKARTTGLGTSDYKTVKRAPCRLLACSL